MANVDDVGTVTHFEEAAAPLGAAVAIGLLTLIEFVFIVLFVYHLAAGYNSVPDQEVLAFWLASATFTLAAILSLYRKFFLPDVLVVKKRKKKYEDLR